MAVESSVSMDRRFQDARPMLDEMHYDPKFDIIFRSIFANTVFVRDLKAGQRVARAERFDCVTLEGWPHSLPRFAVTPPFIE